MQRYASETQILSLLCKFDSIAGKISWLSNSYTEFVTLVIHFPTLRPTSLENLIEEENLLWSYSGSMKIASFVAPKNFITVYSILTQLVDKY